MPSEQAIKQAIKVVMMLSFAAFSLILALSNFCDLLLSMGALPSSIVFRSGNLAFVESMINPYGLGAKVAVILLCIQTFWLLLIADSFILCGYYLCLKRKESSNWIAVSFLLALSLCLLQIIVLEVFMYHQLTEKLMVMMILLLLTWRGLMAEQDKSANGKKKN